MSEISSEIFKKYGIKSIIIAFIFLIGVWLFAHFSASPGTEISVLWGLVKYTKNSSQIENPNNTDRLTIKIFDNITNLDSDSVGVVINKKYAPWKIIVNGEVSNAWNYYVYLIVNDGNHEYIQPGLGDHIDNAFSGKCYLGGGSENSFLKPKNEFINRVYTVSAVITNKKYQVNEVLDRSTILLQSNKIELYRTH